MSDVTTLAQVVRSWELPLATEAEDAAIAAVERRASADGMSPADLALVLEAYTEQWEADHVVAPALRTAVGEALRFAPPILDKVDARAYFEMYRKLRDGGGDVPGLSHAVSRRLLSRASLIAHLLGEERFSCTQVARLLAANEASLDVPHGAIATIARKLRRLPKLDRTAAGDELWEADQQLSLTLFPDSGQSETNEIAGREARTWLPEADIEELLARLSRSDVPEEPFWPYLQMLHWCLTPVEFYDHPASYLYEFAPRGQVGSDLFERYPTVTGNPFLNNAKAVQTLNASWAKNRGGDDAHALVSLLGAIESLPFVPRRQVARVLRAWLVRLIELCTIEPNPLDLTATEDLFEKVADYIAQNDTRTRGVIEQRVVDCLGDLAFHGPGWRSRGLGDGVNASNFSRHKLGDIEFANVDERMAVALEAHGGHLSSAYVADHTRSLGRIIEQRLAESWAAIDEPTAWTVEVLFVAHSRDSSGLPAIETLHGVNVKYDYIDHHDLAGRARASFDPGERISAFQRHVIDQLNMATVRESVRDKFREIAASGA